MLISDLLEVKEEGEELDDVQEKHQYFISVEESLTLVTYVCSLCGNTFLRLGHYKAHQKIHSGVKNHVCSECGKVFSRASHLKQQRIIHTGLSPYKCLRKECFLFGNPETT